MGEDRCRELIEEARADAERRLADYDALARTVTTQEADSPDLPYNLITIAAGRHGAQATIGWADEALALLPATKKATP
ncbi:hypothetical protein [Thermocatellispora tengchongensis]|uniref:hypothetical protein n=1 Tax=Thermocatellispora tengchongensis TaxID=1073253 RepID=UPI00363FF3A4